jgi:hypothetical protein
MPAFEGPQEMSFNRGMVADPQAFARDAGAESWLYLCSEAFAEVEGGMSFADVVASVEEPMNIVAEPPRPMDMDFAREGVAALDGLSRPTLVTCRTGPRSSALVYLYAGLKAGAGPDEVLARAEADGAPFCKSDELKGWVAQGLGELAQGG